MRYLLPATLTPDAPETVMCLNLGDAGKYYQLRFQYVSDDYAPITVDLAIAEDIFVEYLASGDGATPADALLSMLSGAGIYPEVKALPADVAAALDELAHQAVRVVCQRLSGGTMDEATFAEHQPLSVPTFAPSAERIYPTLVGGIE